MDHSERNEIDRLLREGLNHYGAGDAESALSCWRRVLELDPQHPEAREYLQTALDDAPDARAEPGSAATDDVLQEVQRLLQADDPEAALELLETAVAEDGDHLHGYIEMVRSRLLKRYRERLSLGHGIPHQRLSPEQVMQYNLPPEAGFLLSLVDGTTPVKDLVSVSGMDEFRSLQILVQLVDVGIVELRE
jgi:tetratricopeptide (TPR) repeat protein